MMQVLNCVSLSCVNSSVVPSFVILFSSRLSDEIPSVRQTAVTVLTQLVLKDVLKVKGQVSEVAVLLIDPEPHITSLALNFFNELATKVLIHLHSLRALGL